MKQIFIQNFKKIMHETVAEWSCKTPNLPQKCNRQLQELKKRCEKYFERHKKEAKIKICLYNISMAVILRGAKLGFNHTYSMILDYNLRVSIREF